MANDLTRSQANTAAEARKEGKVAYFKKSKLTVGPKRPNPRIHANVVTTDDAGEPTPDQTTPERPADRANNEDRAQRHHKTRRHDGDPLRRDSPVSQPNSQSARTTRGSVHSGSRQSGPHDYWRSTGDRQSLNSSILNPIP